MILHISVAFVVPGIAVVVSLGFLLYKVIGNRDAVSISQNEWVKFTIWWVTLFVAIFLGLSLLSGSLAKFVYVDNTPYLTTSIVQFGLLNQFQFLYLTEQFTNYLAISLLSGLIYASLLALPPVCIRTAVQEDVSKNAAASSFSMLTSTFASVGVCCTTSVISIVTPALSAILAPFASWLLLLAMVLITYSVNSVVFPRFGISPLRIKLLK